MDKNDSSQSVHYLEIPLLLSLSSFNSLLAGSYVPISVEAYSKNQVLGVRLAAVAIQQPEAVHSWMTSHLIGRSLRLQLLHHSLPDDFLHCIVKYRRRLYRSLSCANTELISLGLVTLEEPSYDRHGNESSHGNEALIAFLREGVKAESGAQRRGEGVWKGSIHETRWQRVARALKLRN